MPNLLFASNSSAEFFKNIVNFIWKIEFRRMHRNASTQLKTLETLLTTHNYLMDVIELLIVVCSVSNAESRRSHPVSQ